MTPYVAAAIFYLIVTLPLIKAVGYVEERIAHSERGGGPRPKGKTAKNEAADAEVKLSELAVHAEALDDEHAFAPVLTPSFASEV
jgi:polar amino acid transport system substrate-binding protein